MGSATVLEVILAIILPPVGVFLRYKLGVSGYFFYCVRASLCLILLPYLIWLLLVWMCRFRWSSGSVSC
uniref:Hydrophobic protein OSR8 n=1 Tax=Triticum urartu TaxID=4572 RepID=A0A8R7U9J2_TRIUA